MNNTTTPAPITSGLTFAAEYRLGRLDPITFAASNGRPAETVVRYVHTLEIGDRTFEFSEAAPKGTPLPLTWAQPFPKGTNVLVTLDPQPANVTVNGRDGKPRVASGLFRLRITNIRKA